MRSGRRSVAARRTLSGFIRLNIPRRPIGAPPCPSIPPSFSSRRPGPRRRNLQTAVPLRDRPSSRSQGPRRPAGRTDRQAAHQRGVAYRPGGRRRRPSTHRAAARNERHAARHRLHARRRRDSRQRGHTRPARARTGRRSPRSSRIRRVHALAEARYPVAIEQGYATAQWITREGAAHGLDASRMAVAGESVGGNMTAALALMAKQRGDVTFVQQSMYYPVTDAAMNTDSYDQFAGAGGVPSVDHPGGGHHRHRAPAARADARRRCNETRYWSSALRTPGPCGSAWRWSGWPRPWRCR
jgi:alpha/beta hydrolase fold